MRPGSLITLALAASILSTGCASTRPAPRLTITEYEKGTLFGLEPVTEDAAGVLSDSASATKGVFAYDTTKDGQWEVYIKAGPGKGMTRKTTSPAVDCWPSISHNGEKLAFQSNRDGAFSIYMMNAKTASAQTLIGPGFLPAFSHDDMAIYYHRALQNERTDSIWRFDLKTSQHAQLTTGFDADASPDGKHLAYARANNVTGLAGLWILNLDNGQEIEVLSLPNVSIVLPKWSPDGKRILFTTNQGNHGRLRPVVSADNTTGPEFSAEQIAVIKADGTGLVRLTDNDTGNRGASWSSDGYIYFSSTRGKSRAIWRFRPRLD